jgi:hypothetical protein
MKQRTRRRRRTRRMKEKKWRFGPHGAAAP